MSENVQNQFIDFLISNNFLFLDNEGNKIDFQNLNLSSIIFLGEEILEEDDYDDLDEVIRELAERNYYENTNK